MKQLIISLVAALVFSFFSIGEANVQEKISAPEITVRFDRDFGYFVGDVIAIDYEIKLPEAGFQISLKDLPQSNQAIIRGIEIREVKMRNIRVTSRATFSLEFKFQIFRVFKEPTNLIIPAIDFYYGPKENPRRHKGSLPKVPVKISPLCGKEEPMLQPFFEPGRRPTRIPLMIVLGGGALMILCWLWFLKIMSDRRRHPSPFKKALKEIKKTKPEKYFEILLIFRKAINEKANQAIFAHNLNELIKAFPRAKSRAKEIAELIEVHDNLIFNPNYRPDHEMLLGLKKRIISELKGIARREQWL